MRLGRLLMTVLLAVLMVSACTGHPHRQNEAEAIRDMVQARPGVRDVDLTYSNDILDGTRFELRVSMPRATLTEIESVAERIDTAMGDRFAGYSVRLGFSVADRGAIEISGRDFDPAAVTRDTVFVRQLSEQLPADINSFTWYIGSEMSSVRLADTTAPSAAVETILTVAGDHPVTMQVPPDRDDGIIRPYWDVREPITLELKHRIDDQMGRMPGGIPGYVTVGSTGIDHLTVGLPDTATAYQDLVEIIRIAEAGPDRPMSIRWRWDGDTAKGPVPDWSGYARIGDCEYHPAEQGPGNHVPEALALQERIRNEFDTCPG